MAGAASPQAVQVGGPSGTLVPPEQFGRKICFEDLATGGSVVIFGPERDLLEVVRTHQAFFAHESCGYCTPCRAGNELLIRYLDRVLAGRGEPDDLAAMTRVATTMKSSSRCGLGQAASNPVLSSLEGFRSLYEGRVSEDPEGSRRSFDLEEAVATHRAIRGLSPKIEELPDWAD
jgi:[NiFe] hydrogenase diaphorase moiety large subunit